MGKGFGRGAKSVAIVTHAQTKGKAKKLPKGLRVSKKKQKRDARREDPEDPNSMLETRVRGKPSETQSSMKRLDVQIASIQFKELVQGRGRLKHLRRQIVDEVRDLRRKHHKKQEKLNTRKIADMSKARGKRSD